MGTRRVVRITAMTDDMWGTGNFHAVSEKIAGAIPSVAFSEGR